MNKMGKINREMLLGFLMNALEDDEISRVERELLRHPELRVELAKLQEELSPLNLVYEMVEPPPNLARRTCDKIWAHVDREEQIGESVDKTAGIGPVISLSLPGPHSINHDKVGDRLKFRNNDEVEKPDPLQAVEEMLAASPHLPDESSKRLLRHRETRNQEGKSRESRKSERSPVARTRTRRGRWIDVFAAGGVGILIAILVFPAVNFSKGQLESHFTQSKLQEINRRVGQYEQIQGSSQVMAAETSNQDGLVHYGWQEVKPDQSLLVVDSNTEKPSLTMDSETLFASESTTEPNVGSLGKSLVLGQSPNRDIMFGPTQQIGLEHPQAASQTIFSNVGQLMPVSNSPMMQTTYGQNVIFHNGRIFVRRVPVAVPTE